MTAATGAPAEPTTEPDPAEPADGSVVDGLAEVEQWFRGEASRHQSEILEVDQEISNLETALANLQTQLGALHDLRAALGVRVRSIGAEHVARSHHALFRALLAQRALLQRREDEVLAATESRAAALSERLTEGPTGALFQEFAQFRTQAEPTLGGMPESYRAALLKHHQSVTDKLRDHLARVLGEPVQIEGDEIAAEIAFAVDAPAGDPVGLVLVLPVHEEVHGRWAERPDGLGQWIACRVVQAVYEAASDFPRAQVVAGGHQGLLVIEIDLTGAEPTFVERLEERLVQVLSGAPELAGAGVRLVPRRVQIDYVMPPEDDLPPRDPTDA